MARAPKKADSVYDILYVDSRRIALLLSQFGEDGVLTELIRGTDISSETAGGIDLKLAKADMRDGQRTSLSRKFDPQWLLPLRFLDLAQSLWAEDIGTVRIGQIAKCTGALAITDLGALKELWKSNWAKELITRGIPKGPQTKNMADAFLTVLAMMPHTIHVQMALENDHSVWGALQPDGLVGSSVDLMLKHGSIIQGSWSCVGVVDALPDDQAPPSDLSDRLKDSLANNPIGHVMSAISGMIPAGFGRPASAIGITPLIILREVISREE